LSDAFLFLRTLLERVGKAKKHREYEGARIKETLSKKRKRRWQIGKRRGKIGRKKEKEAK
jgi:hypothetical protein